MLDVNGVEIAGNGSFGANEADPLDANERVRIPVVAGQTYYLHVRGLGDGQSLVTNGYRITMINTEPPVPFDLQLANAASNEGSGNPISSDNTPTFVLRLNEALFLDELLQPPFDEVIQIPFVDTPSPGYRIAIFELSTPSGEDGSPTEVPLAIQPTDDQPLHLRSRAGRRQPSLRGLRGNNRPVGHDRAWIQRTKSHHRYRAPWASLGLH